MLDKAKKLRTKHKLSKDEVIEIYYSLFNSDLTLQKIADKFNISKPTICDIKMKRAWKWLTDELDLINAQTKTA